MGIWVEYKDIQSDPDRLRCHGSADRGDHILDLRME